MISIVIPTYNEAGCLAATLRWLWKGDAANLVQEIVVCDGGSTDDTINIAHAEGVAVLPCARKGRAAQMNAGAQKASGSILYFLHADTLPPLGYSTEIAAAVHDGIGAGCYRLSFDHPSRFLALNCWFTRFNLDAFRFGDQSLFVTRDLFEKVGGFDEGHIVLEDQELVKRLRKHASFSVLKRAVRTSARKYVENGIYRTQAIFFLVYFLYRLGVSQQGLVSLYRRLIPQDKL